MLTDREEVRIRVLSCYILKAEKDLKELNRQIAEFQEDLEDKSFEQIKKAIEEKDTLSIIMDSFLKEQKELLEKKLAKAESSAEIMETAKKLKSVLSDLLKEVI